MLQEFKAGRDSQGLGREGQTSWDFELGLEGEFCGKDGKGRANLVCSA